MSKYSPVRVANPLTENHLVYVHPTQKLQLRISEFMEIQDIDLISDFLVKSDEWHNNDGTCVYEFEQKADFTEWCDLGDTFLGEILLVGKNSCSSLNVVLNSAKMNRCLTIINPCYCEVKVCPYQTLEIILFQDLKCKVYPGSGFDYMLTGEEVLRIAPHSFSTKIIKPVDGFIVRPRHIKGVRQEYHYFFELDVNSLADVMSWKKGTYSGGRIVFSKNGKEPYSHVVSIHLNVRRKTYRLEQRKKKKEKGVWHTPHVRTQGRVFCSDYRIDPEVREVNFEPMAMGKLSDGCNTMEFADTGPGTLFLPDQSLKQRPDLSY